MALETRTLDDWLDRHADAASLKPVGVALRAFRQTVPPLAWAVIDTLELVREALRIRPDLPVALASGYITAEIEQSALAEGVKALIHKPNDVEELCATVQRLILDNTAA